MTIKEIILDDTTEPIDTKVSRVLRECNICVGLTGYKYLKTAIQLAFAEKSVIEITKDIYPYIAAKESVSPTSVERCIRNAIDKAWALQKELPSEIIEYLFKYSKCNGKYRPTNTVFIESIAEEIRLYCRLSKYL